MDQRDPSSDPLRGPPSPARGEGDAARRLYEPPWEQSLAVRDLTLSRGQRTLVEGLSFDLEPGQAMMLSGPNGAGKTTLLRAVAGLVRPAAGTIRFDVEEPGAHFHLLGHQDGLKPGRLAGEELDFAARWCGANRTEIEGAIDRLRLAPLLDLPVRALSAGQRRRLTFARLLAAPRRLWLLDEPTAPLDARWREAFDLMAMTHLAVGGMILVAAHDPLAFARHTLTIGGEP